MSSSILWNTMRILCAQGFDTFIDVGPGNTLAKLMKRIDSAVSAVAVDSLGSPDAVERLLKGEVRS